jgi:MFS family permease
MFAALALPNFRRYVSGQSLSLIGTWVETVAQALLVLRLTHSGTVLSLTTAARYAPILLLSPYAGLLVDRYSERHVLLATQIGLGLVAVAPTFPTAVAACGLAGVATVIFLTTGNSTIQLASESAYRGRVTALWSMALVGTTPIGSPIIGALSDVAGPRYALALGAAACLTAVIVGGWPRRGLRRNTPTERSSRRNPVPATRAQTQKEP